MKSPFLPELSSVCVWLDLQTVSPVREVGLAGYFCKKIPKHFQKSILIFSHVLETSLLCPGLELRRAVDVCSHVPVPLRPLCSRPGDQVGAFPHQQGIPGTGHVPAWM